MNGAGKARNNSATCHSHFPSLKVEINGCHNANNLPVWRTRIHIVYLEWALNGVTHRTHRAVGVGGKPLRSFAGVAVGLLNHIRLDFVETGEKKLRFARVI